MANIKVSYPAASDATITLASLATDSTGLTGRQSTAIDNTTNLYLDYIVSGKITCGATVAVAQRAQIWVIPSTDGTNYPDTVTGTDAARTLTAGSKTYIGRLVVELVADATTANKTYHFAGVSIASLFGGFCPPKFIFFVTHNFTSGLNATAANQQIRVLPYFETIT
jgi:hypothetical protein